MGHAAILTIDTMAEQMLATLFLPLLANPKAPIDLPLNVTWQFQLACLPSELVD